MIPIIRWELRRRRTALMWWTAGSVLLSVAILALYPSIRDQANQLNQVLNQLPQGLRELKTGGANSVNVADPADFLNSQLFYATLPILWIILSITRGSGILGREEQNHTLELLLARPVSRNRLLTAKALSLVLEFVVIGGATLLAVVLLAPVFAIHIGSLGLALTTLYTVLFSLSFGFIAFALQAATSFARRMATAVAVVISFGGYVIASLSGLTHWLQNPAKLAPFHYFEPLKLLHRQAVTGLNIYLISVFIVTLTVSYFGFRKRDIS